MDPWYRTKDDHVVWKRAAAGGVLTPECFSKREMCTKAGRKLISGAFSIAFGERMCIILIPTYLMDHMY